MKKLIFIRHEKTLENIVDLKKGIKFIGRNTQADIIKPKQEKIDSIKEEFKNCSLLFSSPSKRCKQSLELITNKKTIIDENLNEINYGDLDGMHLKEAQEKYPSLFNEWKKGGDPKFPHGENSQDVLERYKLFLKNILEFKEENIGICTHNVFLRTVVGYNLEIPMKDWFKINIPHFEAINFEFQKNNSKLIYKDPINKKYKLLENLMKGYFVALTPDERIKREVLEAKQKATELFGKQKYVEDSPHLTLYLSIAGDLKKVEKKLENLVYKKKSIDALILDEFIEFPKDKLAGGGTSLGIKFNEKTNTIIHSLQKDIAKTLNNLRLGMVHPRYQNPQLPLPMIESIEKYGFPFINGNNEKPILMPHISFCCFNNQENADKFKVIYPIEKFCGSMKFSKLSLYRLYPDDKTHLIRDFQLQ